jgi:hypothetical protein
MKPEISGLGIVLLGSFNPKIFHPAWFAAHHLIRELEAEEAKIEIVHNDITIFELDWFRLEVTRERFNIFTEQEAYFEPLTDLVIGTFSLLCHTPIAKMGINSSLHYRMRSEKEWHEVGDRLAPKEPWKDIMKKPGMLKLEMTEKHYEGPKGYIRIIVEPSFTCQPGLRITVNDHYDIDNNSKNVIDCNEIIEILGKSWKSSIEKAKSVAPKLIRQGE